MRVPGQEFFVPAINSFAGMARSYPPLKSFKLIIVPNPFRITDARSIKPIGRATVNRRRAEPADGCKIIDMQTRANQMIGNMKHHHLADDQRYQAIASCTACTRDRPY